MNIVIETAGYCYDNGKPTQRAGCAAVLKAQEGEQVKTRTITMPLGSATGNQSEVHAALLGLLSVKPKFRNEQTKIVVASFASRMLQRNDNGDWSNKAIKNASQIEKLRETAKLFSNLIIESEHNTVAHELAKQVTESQVQYDSGSQKDDRETDQNINVVVHNGDIIADPVDDGQQENIGYINQELVELCGGPGQEGSD